MGNAAAAAATTAAIATAAAAAATLASLAPKLRHELLEVRERALHALAFKLDNALLLDSDVGKSDAALRSLLEWFNHADTGAREAQVHQVSCPEC
jgi:hypothetical protein